MIKFSIRILAERDDNQEVLGEAFSEVLAPPYIFQSEKSDDYLYMAFEKLLGSVVRDVDSRLTTFPPSPATEAWLLNSFKAVLKNYEPEGKADFINRIEKLFEVFGDDDLEAPE